MSNHIPFDLQEEIIKRLPAKSLLKFRAVSKPWKCLIDSAKFIADYNPRSEHLFIHSVHCSRYKRSRYNTKYEYLHRCVKIIEDDTFPRHKFSLNVPSSCVNMDRYVIGYSHGLFCFFGHNPGTRGKDICVAVIWNPSIRKSVDIVVPNSSQYSVLGFGVCPNTNDPKIVRIQMPMVYVTNYCPWYVEVFTLSSEVWRKPLSKLPNKWFDILFGGNHVVIEGLIYWFAYERIGSDDKLYTIIAFDLTSEEFNQVHLPDKLAFNKRGSFSYYPMRKLGESLAVVKSKIKVHREVFEIWLMENDVSKSFTKIFTINLPYSPERTILGFRKNGGLIMETRDYGQPCLYIVNLDQGEHIDLGFIEIIMVHSLWPPTRNHYYCLISQICT